MEGHVSKPTAVVTVIHKGLVLSAHEVPIEGLTEHSKYFEARLSSRWCVPAGQPVALQLDISEPEHAAPAQHMLAFISGQGLPQHLLCHPSTTTSSSSSSSASAQQELVVLAHLADKYQAPQLLHTTLSALDRLFTHEGPSLTAATFLLQQSSDSIRDTKGFDRLHKLARTQVMVQLQDLEAVLQEPGLLGVLMHLPCDMLVLLLGSPHTRVACEGSVVAAISWWLAAQPPGCVDRASLQRLASLVRLRGLPRTYVSNVLLQLAWYNSSCELDALPQALAYVDAIDAVQQQGSASDTPPDHRASSGSGSGVCAGRHSSSGRSGSGSAADRAEVLETTRALGIALEPLIRDSPFWIGALQGPREQSSIQALVLTAVLSKGRVAAAYRDFFGAGASTGNTSDSGSRTDSVATTGEWQLVRGGVGQFAGLQWQVLFRLKAASRHGSSAGPDKRQSRAHHCQQQQQLAGSKRKQREFLQQEAAAAAAIAAAAAGAGRGERSQAVLQQVMLDSMEHAGDAGEGAPPAAPDGAAQQAVATGGGAAALAAGPDAAAAAPAAAATAGTANGQTDDSPLGGSTAGSNAGSGPRGGSRQPEGCVSWQLQFGVRFSVPYLPEQESRRRPSLLLRPPQLQHRQAWDPAQCVMTRGQQERQGGLALSKIPRLLEEGAVLPCVGLLPTMLPGSTGSKWGKVCSERLARVMEADGLVRVSVSISEML